MIEISVVLCSYNRIASLEKVLESLVDQSLPPEQFEVVVVDDGSTDGTSERVKAMQVPYKLTLCTQKNAGLATARNTGIMAATGWVVLFIDDDIAVIGSSNMDIRSFSLNMEVSVLVSSREFTDRMRIVEDHYRAQSFRLDADEWARRPLGGKVLDGLARLTSALQ